MENIKLRDFQRGFSRKMASCSILLGEEVLGYYLVRQDYEKLVSDKKEGEKEVLSDKVVRQAEDYVPAPQPPVIFTEPVQDEAEEEIPFTEEDVPTRTCVLCRAVAEIEHYEWDTDSGEGIWRDMCAQCARKAGGQNRKIV